MSKRSMRATRLAALLSGLLVLGAGCAGAGAEAGEQHAEVAPDERKLGAASADDIVDIDVTGHQLDLPDEIPSGWVTFRLHNRSDQTHFAVIELLPDGVTVEDSESEVVPVFQDAMDLINAGDPEAGFAEFENLPAWYFDVVFMGGPGLVAPGETVETTVNLEPGTYVLECYVKNPEGIFHTTHGMITGLTVTDDGSGASEPDADVDVTVSSEDGFTVDGHFRRGRQTVAVHFEDQTVHGNQLGHDVHIAQLQPGRSRPDRGQAGGADANDVAAWMNWITGLETPAPARFVGGTHEMPEGNVAYLDVTLEPGRYVLVAEVDDPADKGMLHTFDVYGSPAG